MLGAAFAPSFFWLTESLGVRGLGVGVILRMHKLSTRQRTLAAAVNFAGYGVHSAQPVTMTIGPAPADNGITICRIKSDGTTTAPAPVHFSRVTRTTLCTTLDLGDSVSVATVEHVMSALSGIPRHRG